MPPLPDAARRRWTRLLLASALGLGLLAWLLRQVDTAPLFAAFAATPHWLWVLAVAGLWASYALRAERLRREWTAWFAADAARGTAPGFVDCLATTSPTDPVSVRLRAGTRADWTCPATATVSPPAEIACLRITVPEDPAATDGPTVDLPVAVITRPDQQETVPVVYLDGGPGGDGIGMAPYLADHPLARTRPVVIVGQRGTPFAEPTFSPNFFYFFWEFIFQ